MKVTEEELIKRLKEVFVYDVHMALAAEGEYEEEKYYKMVEEAGWSAEYYMGHRDAIHMVLMILMGGKKIAEYAMEIIDTIASLEEAKEEMS